MSSLLNGGRVAVYEQLTRVFDVCRAVSPSALGLVPQLWVGMVRMAALVAAAPERATTADSCDCI